MYVEVWEKENVWVGFLHEKKGETNLTIFYSANCLFLKNIYYVYLMPYIVCLLCVWNPLRLVLIFLESVYSYFLKPTPQNSAFGTLDVLPRWWVWLHPSLCVFRSQHFFLFEYPPEVCHNPWTHTNPKKRTGSSSHHHFSGLNSLLNNFRSVKNSFRSTCPIFLVSSRPNWVPLFVVNQHPPKHSSQALFQHTSGGSLGRNFWWLGFV